MDYCNSNLNPRNFSSSLFFFVLFLFTLPFPLSLFSVPILFLLLFFFLLVFFLFFLFFFHHLIPLFCSQVEEILRGVRLHFPNFVSGLTATAEAKAQLGLGHSYSRAKVKFNVNRVDNMIIQVWVLVNIGVARCLTCAFVKF